METRETPRMEIGERQILGRGRMGRMERALLFPEQRWFGYALSRTSTVYQGESRPLPMA